MIKKTILKDIYYKGYGTFNGLDTVVKLSPAKSNNGIKIIRTDLFENNIIQVNNDAMKPAWVIGLTWSHAMYIITLNKLLEKGWL